jgi:hypothetical protein
MANSNQVDQCLAALAVVYPQHFKQQQNAPMARAIYHRILSDIGGSLLEAATMQWLSTSRPFHPSPGELRDLALRMSNANEPSAEEAWIEVIDAIRKIGSYGSPQWSNDMITNTVKAFGWVDLCMTETDQMSYARDSFMKIYRSQAARRHESNLMLPEVRQAIEKLTQEKRHALNSPSES